MDKTDKAVILAKLAIVFELMMDIEYDFEKSDIGNIDKLETLRDINDKLYFAHGKMVDYIKGNF